jgi:cobalt-zinc-cadmium efflux system outer membrane protein
VFGQVRILLMAAAGWMPCLGFAPAADPNLAAAGGRAMSAPARLSLAEAKRQAFSNNWDLLAARSDMDLAVAQQIVAKEFPNPAFSIATAKIDLNHSNDTPAGSGLWNRSYDTVFAINQLLEVAGKRAARQASALAGFEAARSRLADARRTLDAGVTRAYVAAALAQDNSRILTESAGYLRKEAQIAAIRLKAGDISQSELDQIEIAAAQDELNAANASSAAIQQKIALEVLIGIKDPKGNLTLADQVEELAAAQPDLGERNLATRPDLAAAEAALRQAQADLRLQRAFRIPDPTVGVQYEHAPPDAPNTVGVGVSLPLPLWNHNLGAISAATAALQRVRIDLEKTRAQVASDVATAQTGYREAVARRHTYEDQLRQKSERVRTTISLAYEKGGATLLDLLEAQRNDNTVRLATAQAAADAATAAAGLAAALNNTAPDLAGREDP